MFSTPTCFNECERATRVSESYKGLHTPFYPTDHKALIVTL